MIKKWERKNGERELAKKKRINNEEWDRKGIKTKQKRNGHGKLKKRDNKKKKKKGRKANK